jgi:hypothetical protein
MKCRLTFPILVCGAMAHVGFAQEWKPANPRLLTRWANDVSPERVHPEYPRPHLVRDRWFNLNGLWQFAEAQTGENPPLGKELSGRILVPFPVESALSGVGRMIPRVWYRRTFTLPPAWKGQSVLLHFEAVDWETKVWLNGNFLGEHRGGYDRFSFDLTPHLRATGEQELVVGVWDPTDTGTQPRGKQVLKPEGIWYTPSTGIWQTVWLEPVPPIHIADVHVQTTIMPATARVRVRVSRPGKGLRLHAITRWSEPSTQGLSTVQHEQTRTTTVPEGQTEAEVELRFRQPRLWSPEAPHLYDLQVELLGPDDEVIDQTQSYFGLRQVDVAPDDQGVPRIRLNGKPYFMIGPLDQGFWPDGLHTPPTDAAMKFDLEMTKKLGFNTTRKHIKVEPARWYYYCDQLGLLVWQDMPSGDQIVPLGRGEMKRTPESAQQYELELKRMIDQLRHFPCIVMWVPFNEGWGQFDTRRITEWIKQYDPTRLVNNASGWNDMKVGDVHDIHVYPGPGAPPLENRRAGVLGEFGGLGLAIKGHLWDERTWSYRGVADSADLTRRYEQLLQRVYQLKEKQGLCAAIYTQITDVEVEANGLLTYDRAVVKVDVDRVAAANRGDFSQLPVFEIVVPTAREQALSWRYTFDPPGEDWFKPEFEARTWKEGPGGFGTAFTPGAVVRTEWKSRDIWIRREFELREGPFDNLVLVLHHDEDAEVYLNGVLAARVSGFITDYEDVAIRPEAMKTLKQGKNVIAIHCRQTGGGQYIDAGLSRWKKRPAP